jgi:acyl-CoA thioesterase FadM
MLWSTQQNRLVARAKGIGVYYDYKTLKSCIIPDFIAAKLAALKNT